MVSRARKLSHNSDTYEKANPYIKPLLVKLKQLKEQHGRKRKTTSKSKGRRLLLRVQSSPKSVKGTSSSKPAKAEDDEGPTVMSPSTLERLFGPPLLSSSASSEEEDEEVVDLVTPDKKKEKATRTSSTTSACTSASKPFWNSQKQQMQLVLPSGETMDIGEPPVVNKKAPKRMSQKPASLMKRVSSKRAAGMAAIGDRVVEDITMVNG